jgi:signal transduction histidine kinase/CheY-like chemotaxis protein/HPt (histidine-containing phosphotransfer) domain-containing protein
MMKKLNFLFFVNTLFWLCSSVISHTVSAQQVDSKNANNHDFTKQLLIVKKLKDKDQSLILLEELLSSKNLTEKQKLTVLLAQGELLLSRTQYEDTIDVLFAARAIALQLDEFLLGAQTNKLLGVVYYYQGELELALAAYQQSLTFYEKEANLGRLSNQLSIKKANLLNNIALVHTSMGNNTNSLLHYQRADSLYQQYGSEQDKVDVRLNIALLHVILKRFDIAIAMLTEVIANFELLGDELPSIAKATAGLGIAYKHSGKYNLAKKHTLEALKYFQQNGHQHDTASELHNLSAIYIYLLDYENAIEYAQKTIALSKEIGHQKAYAGGLQTLAKVYFYQGEVLLAQKKINLSNVIAKKISYKSVLIDNLAISALIFSALGDHSQAYRDFLAYEIHQRDADNVLLNEQLAKFESEQLAQQVIRLKQKQNLSKLKATKAQQKRNFTLVAVVLLLLLALSVYRRYLETSLTTKLEKRVYQRTKELELTTKELLQANKVKSQFLANMSHEIRTPLTAIVGHAEAIIHDGINQEYLTNEIDIIHGNSLHLLELINDILDLSKIEADKFELDIKPQNIEDILQELTNMFNEQAQKKGLLFSIEHQLQFPFVICTDGRRLRQVLINLCSNAIKFTLKGSVILNVEVIDKQLVFTITDTGIGLTEEQRTQVFDIFAQADSSISRRFGGSGLGLSLSIQLAKLMGGDITVQSTFSKGSCFRFVIPFTLSLPHSSLDINSLLPKEVLKLTPLTGRILLADDHDDNRRLIARLLEGIGLEVFTATNGLEAIEICLEHNPPLVLLDIQMPEMDGVTAFRQLRKLGFQQPIYALTANAMSHEISHYLALGFTGHLKKPIERVSFINTITQHYNDINSSCSSQTHKRSHHKDVIASSAEQIENIDFSDLIVDFKKSLIKEKQLLTLYFEDRDRAQLATTVHRISGAGQMFGFTELSQVAKELDIYIKNTPFIESTTALEEQVKQNDVIDGLMYCLIDEISLVHSE